MNLLNSLFNCCNKIVDPILPPSYEEDSQEIDRPNQHVVETVFRRTILYYDPHSSSCPVDRDREVLDQPVDKEMISKLNRCILRAIYEGDVLHNDAHGKGKEITGNCSVYEGDFLYGLAHGSGKLTYGNKNVYEGEFQNGVPCGKGKILYAHGRTLCESDFVCTNPADGELTSLDGRKFREGCELFSWQ